MSFEQIVGSQLMKNQSDNALLSTIVRLEQAIRDQIRFRQKPIVILRSNANNLSSNVTDGTMILPSGPVPANERWVVADWNLNYTTPAGTVRIIIVDANENEKNNILRDVNSSTNGTGGTVLETGDRLAVVGQDAGAGVFGCYFSGYSQELK